MPGKPLIRLTVISLCIFAWGCGPAQLNQVKQDARHAGFRELILPSGYFNLYTLVKTTPGYESATIYIEGDGYAFVSRNRVSRNPTPGNPMGMRLALADDSANVFYLGRPCQYIDLSNEPNCHARFWTIARSSSEVVESMNSAIDQLKARFGITRLRLVGYSGGATIAAILAAIRRDITDLRTVAGNLDIDTFTRVHGVTPLSESLNPVSYAADLVTVPQLHFQGGRDMVIGDEIFSSYRSALQKHDPVSKCIDMRVIDDVSHEDGWDTVWPLLNQVPVVCKAHYKSP